MTHLLSSLASGRVLVALEGGYNVKSIKYSVAAIVRVLLGEAPPVLPEPTAPPRPSCVYQRYSPSLVTVLSLVRLLH